MMVYDNINNNILMITSRYCCVFLMQCKMFTFCEDLDKDIWISFYHDAYLIMHAQTAAWMCFEFPELSGK